MAFQNKVLNGTKTYNGRTYKEGESFTSAHDLGKDNDNIESTKMEVKMVRNIEPSSIGKKISGKDK